MRLLSVLLTVCCAIVVVTGYQRYQGGTHSPEDEFCNWLVYQCPFVASKRRPVEKVAEALIVTDFQLLANRFIEIIDLENKFRIKAFFTFVWKMPPCATWNEDILINETTLSIEAKRVERCEFSRHSTWYPRVRLTNAYENSAVIEEALIETITINNDGLASTVAGHLFDLSCQLTFSQFPYDEQTCLMTVVNSENTNTVNFTNVKMIVPQSFVDDGDIWIMLNHSITPFMSVKTPRGDEKSGWQFSFSLKRKQQYYNVTIFLTIELLISLQVAALMLPPDDSNRSAYSITVMLGFSISQSIFTQNIPKTSQTVYIFIYIGAYMVIGSLITIYSVFMCFFHQFISHGKWKGVPTARIVDLVILICSIIAIAAVNGYYFDHTVPDHRKN